MAIVCSRYHSTRNFSWQPETRCFVAEASDLVKFPRCHDDRVYDDACDTGFFLVSHRTGDSVLFVQDGTDMNGDEVAGWRYKAVKESGPGGRWVPTVKDFTVLIIND